MIWVSHLLPPFYWCYKWDFCAILQDVCLVVKEHDVDIVSELRHGGQDEGDSGYDDHWHGGEGKYLKNIIHL